MTDAFQPAPAPSPGATPAAVTVPSFVVTWPKIWAICGTLALFIGGGFLALIGIVYNNIDKSIVHLESKVEALDNKMMGAAKDAGSLQVLLNEAPELRKNIQETHDKVIGHDARFDSIDKAIVSINRSIDRLATSNYNIQQSLNELTIKAENIQRSIQRIPGMPK